MKIEKVTNTYKNGALTLLAKGVEGGGTVSVMLHNIQSPDYGFRFFSIGTKEMLDDKENCGQFIANAYHTFYLNEGEELYTTSTSAPNSLTNNYTVIYYNKEQFSTQPQATPINLSGTIQLNQQ